MLPLEPLVPVVQRPCWLVVLLCLCSSRAKLAILLVAASAACGPSYTTRDRWSVSSACAQLMQSSESLCDLSSLHFSIVTLFKV